MGKFGRVPGISQPAAGRRTAPTRVRNPQPYAARSRRKCSAEWPQRARAIQPISSRISSACASWDSDPCWTSRDRRTSARGPGRLFLVVVLALELVLALGELPAEHHQFVLADEFPGARKHLLLLFLGVMLDEIPEDLRLGGKIMRAELALVDLGEEEIHDAVFLHRIVEELGVLSLARRIAECRIEDLLFDGRMHVQRGLDAPQQWLGVGGVIGRRLLELTQEPTNLFVILLQELDRILPFFRLGRHVLGTSFWAR